MRSLLLVVLLAAATLRSGPTEAGPYYLLNFVGLHFEAPDSNPDEWLAVGEGLEAIGHISAFGPRLAPHLHPATHEYTFRFSGLVVTDVYYDSPTQTLNLEFANNARARFYEDPRATGTLADFGMTPSDPTVPTTFIDGALLMGADLDNFRLYYVFMLDQGGCFSEIRFDEGVLYDGGQINPIDGWTGGGLLGPVDAVAYPGYEGQICGEIIIQTAPTKGTVGSGLCDLVVPTARATWGSIKRTYR